MNLDHKKKRLKILKSYKKYLEFTKFKTKSNTINNRFINQLAVGLGIFSEKTPDIEIMFTKNASNFDTINTTKDIKKNFLKSRNFKDSDFFKDGANVLYKTVCDKNTDPKFISDFISYYMSKIKKHNYFIAFLKKTLTSIIKTQNSKINGIKIAITGRINGSPRSRQKVINIGTISLQKISAPIVHSKSVSYTNNGTLGVKVWVNKK